MSSFDPELLRLLAATDAARPLAPGATFTPESLVAAAARRARRQLLCASAALLLAAVLFAAWPRPTPEDAERPTDRTAVAALQADLARIQRSFAQSLLHPVANARTNDDPHEPRAATTLRCELAAARAAAALATAFPKRTHR